jgi:hypothetical protein
MTYRVPRFGVAAVLAAFLAGAPQAALAQDAGGPLVCGSPYVIASGDSLSSVAGRVYGDPKRYDILFQANRDVIGDDPGSVAVGMSILLPCLDANGQPMTPEAAAAAKTAMAAAIASTGPLEAAELDVLFGPVALFPDSLLTQVLMAATFPLDVVKADRFLKESVALSDKDRASAVEAQPWDASVRQLAAGFPELVTRMADHIDWTEQAGEAVVAQTEDVLDSIQRLRKAARDNGYLTDNQAQTVTEVNDVIQIVPADPEVVYVPVYDSQVVYTTPISAYSVYDPFYYGYDNDDWSDALAAGAIIFGAALVLDEIFDDGDRLRDWWDDGGSIDWNTGDINIDRGDISIDRGDRINIGDGDRINIDRGDRANIGDGGRVNIGDGDRANIGNRPPVGVALPGRIGGPEGDALAGGRGGTFAPDAASREAARQKIEARKATTPSLADLPANRPAANVPARNPAGAAATTRTPSAAARPAASTRPANVSRPSASNRSAATSRPSSANRSAVSGANRSGQSAFRQSGGSRASAGASRGRASAGGRSGGGGGRRR